MTKKDRVEELRKEYFIQSAMFMYPKAVLVSQEMLEMITNYKDGLLEFTGDGNMLYELQDCKGDLIMVPLLLDESVEYWDFYKLTISEYYIDLNKLYGMKNVDEIHKRIEWAAQLLVQEGFANNIEEVINDVYIILKNKETRDGHK